MPGWQENTTIIISEETRNSSSNSSLRPYGYECNEWGPTQYALLHTASLFNAIAFLIPHTFGASFLATRALMSLAYATLILSAIFGHSACSVDLFLWNAALLLINTLHLAYSTWRFLPAKIPADLNSLYRKLFLPLGVPRDLFIQVTRESHIRQLPTGHSYSADTPNRRILSILLSGKLKVTYGVSTLLHHIKPFEFIDSTEWYTYNAFPSNFNASFQQVSITALEPCTYLYWPCDTLRMLMNSHSSIGLLMDCLIGKDISEKLYSVAEQQASMMKMAQQPRHVGSCGPAVRTSRSPFGPWQDELLRSQSVDQIHTTSLGQVRSQHWRRNQLRLTWQRKYEKLVPSPAEFGFYDQRSSRRRSVKRLLPANHRHEDRDEIDAFDSAETTTNEDQEMKDFLSPTCSFSSSGFRSSESRKSKSSAGVARIRSRQIVSGITSSPTSSNGSLSHPHHRAQHPWNKVKFTTQL